MNTKQSKAHKEKVKEIIENIKRGKPMTILGIDPGLSGGLCFYKPAIGNYESYVSFHPMPLIDDHGSKTIDVVTLYKLLEIHDLNYIILEKVHAMPKQGSVSMFTFGKGFGKIEATIELYKSIHGVDIYEQVPPQTWKKFAGLLKATKDEAVNKLGANLITKLNEIKRKDHRIACAEAYFMCKYMENKYGRI